MKSSVFWDITPRIPLEVNYFSDEHIASIFRIEKEAKQEAGLKKEQADPSETVL
jgi:hypothetical protein